MQGEIRPGYKRTEVGVIPEDWTVSPLRDLVDPERGIRYGIVQPGPFIHNGRLLIRGQDYSKGWVDATEMYRVGDAIEARYKNARVAAGDLIITIVGASTGHIEEVPSWLDTANLTQTTARIAIDRRKAEPRFAKYILASGLGDSHVANYVKGGAQPGLNCGDVEKFLIPHPNSVEEQGAIAAALSDADALIAALEGMIAKKRDLKQAAMQHLLTGKTRLPGFSGEWEVTLLGDLERSRLVQLGRGKVISKIDIDREPGVNPIYSSSVQLSGLFGRYKRHMFDEEMITWSVDGGGHFFYRPKHKFSVTNVCGFMRLDKSSLNCKFLAVQLQFLHGKLKFDYQDKAHPSVIRKAYKLAVPSIEEQTAIAEVFSDMDVDLAALEAQATKARAVKQGMMQELLTGRVRLV